MNAKNEKEVLNDWAEHYENAKQALNNAYKLAIAHNRQTEAIAEARKASNECSKFMQALRKIADS